MRVWLVTGAARGMGASIVRAALAAGDQVVATARHPEEISATFGGHGDGHGVRLDVTSVDQSTAAVAQAVERFRRNDLVVTTPACRSKDFFEEMSPSQVEQQLATTLLGPMNVTLAVLPAMPHQRSGHLIAISSGAGLVGFPYSSAYAASEFGLEGWMGALAPEVEPFGIRTTIVNPGFFRTGLAGPESMIWPDVVVEDYADRSAEQRRWWQSQDGRQPGDPERLAAALGSLVDEDVPTSRAHRQRRPDRTRRRSDEPWPNATPPRSPPRPVSTIRRPEAIVDHRLSATGSCSEAAPAPSPPAGRLDLVA